jgi:hypothetical protein
MEVAVYMSVSGLNTMATGFNVKEAMKWDCCHIVRKSLFRTLNNRSSHPGF